MVNCSSPGCDFKAEAMIDGRFLCAICTSSEAPSIVSNAEDTLKTVARIMANPWRRFPKTVEKAVQGYLWRWKDAGLMEIKSPEGNLYDVARDGCSCPGWKFYSKCKHHRNLLNMGAFGKS